jgi:PIN like domain
MKTYAQVENSIAGFAAEVGKGVREHPRIERKELEAQINAALGPVQERLSELRKSHPDPLTGGDPIGADSIRDALEPLLEGRIGEKRDLASLTKEGAKRYARKVPPGWADAKNKLEPDCYGDLAIWLDAIAKAKNDAKPVILVTEDRKKDWWWEHAGKTIGPQPQLVEEMQEVAHQKFWMYMLGPFMEEASKFLGIELEDAERKDVMRAGSAAQHKRLVINDYLSAFEPDHGFTTLGGRFNSYLSKEVSPNQIVYTSPEELGSGSFASPGWPVRQGWVDRVEVGEESALLTVEWRPNLIDFGPQRPANRLICDVRAPDGASHLAARRDTTFNAAFRYPDNFEGVEEADSGPYSYSWFFQAAGSDDGGEEIASGIFEIPSASA